MDRCGDCPILEENETNNCSIYFDRCQGDTNSDECVEALIDYANEIELELDNIKEAK